MQHMYTHIAVVWDVARGYREGSIFDAAHFIGCNLTHATGYIFVACMYIHVVHCMVVLW